MAIDPSRYAIVTSEYRYASLVVAGIGTVYGKARTLELESNFPSLTGLSALCTALSAIVGVPRRRIELVISGTSVLDPDLFATQTPTIRVTCAELGLTNKDFIVTRMIINEDEAFTALEAIGGN